MTSDMAEPAGGTNWHREKITAADEGSQVQHVQFGGELDQATADNGSDGVEAATRQRLVDINKRQGQGGHVHMITADRPSGPVGPVPSQPSPGEESAESAQQVGPDIRAVLGSLTRHVAKLESDNERLRRDNDRLRAQVKRLRDQVQAIGGQVARQVGELLASTGD